MLSLEIFFNLPLNYNGEFPKMSKMMPKKIETKKSNFYIIIINRFLGIWDGLTVKFHPYELRKPSEKNLDRPYPQMWGLVL